ncbi:MAG: DUF1015 domain-containing protein [Chloroflexota bacterium]|nr:DUF1015 domain-containing protein [Chloroflexota bacterium]
MPRIAPFRGLRFREEVCGPTGSLLATAYDAVDDRLTHKLLSASAHNVLRLELPAVTPAPDQDHYEAAADLFARWRDEGALVPDPEPAYYVLGHDFVHHGRRLTQLGLVCLCSLHDWDEKEILPHERTHPGPREGRLRHLRALRATFSLGILVARDPDRELRGFLEAVAAGPELAGVQRNWFDGHRIWRVDPKTVPPAALAAAGEAPLYMGDGHHRYEAALAYRDEVGGGLEEMVEVADPTTPSEVSAEPTPEIKGGRGASMGYVVSAQDPGLLVLGAHRVLRTDINSLAPLVEAGWEVTERLPAAAVLGRVAALERESPEEGTDPVLWHVGRDEARCLTLPAGALPRWAVRGQSALWNRQESGLVDRQLLLSLSADDGEITYTRDTRLAVALVRSGGAGSALLMPALDLARVMAIADAGEILPAKTTHFYPKPPAGLVMRRLAGGP